MSPSSNSSGPLVSLIMGSLSDHDALVKCRKTLDSLGISHEAKVLSAHRTPSELVNYVEGLETQGTQVVIAAAGMAAHLAGVVAAHSKLPILGIPMASGSLAGVDALLSVSQMPPGVPVGTLGIGSAGGVNAAYMAARIIALSNADVRTRMEEALEANRAKVLGAEAPKEY